MPQYGFFGVYVSFTDFFVFHFIFFQMYKKICPSCKFFFKAPVILGTKKQPRVAIEKERKKENGRKP